MAPKKTDPPPLDLVFAALADPTRRALLTRMIHGEATVCDLAAPIRMSLPAVSKHLRVLENAGLIDRRIDGRTHRLRFNPAPLREATQWIERHRKFWNGSLDRLAHLVEPATETPPTPPKKGKKTPCKPTHRNTPLN